MIKQLSVKRLGTVILLPFAASLNLSGCAMLGKSSKPKPEPFHGQWQFCEIVPQKPLACLEQEDVEKLREALIRCNSVRDSR